MQKGHANNFNFPDPARPLGGPEREESVGGKGGLEEVDETMVEVRRNWAMMFQENVVFYFE